MKIKQLLLGKRPERMEKAHHLITLIIRITLIIAVVTSVINIRWLLGTLALLTFILTFLPRVIERRYKIDIPIEFEIIIILFIYTGIFLGDAKSYYTTFWWWDVVLHTSSGVVLGFIGFAILYILYATKKLKASPFTIAMFSFTFAVALGALWEIFEFAMDHIPGVIMQKGGISDTMWDLIVDSLGALFASAIGYIYIKTGEAPLIDKILKRFIKDNPRLFK